jgi:hypothetical protein
MGTVIDTLERVLPRVLEIQRRYPNAPGQVPGVRYRDGSAAVSKTGRWRLVARSTQGGPR